MLRNRKLVNAFGVPALGWLAYVFYGFFSDSGIWKLVNGWLSTEYLEASPAGVFALSVLIGFLPLGVAMAAVHRLIAGRR